jgi:ADP-ribose pyrophosphatase
MFEVLSRKILCRGRKYSFVEEEFRRPDGVPARIEKLEHPGAVVIVPRLADGRLALVRQYRAAVKQSLLEFPAGTIETGEIPLDCAKREIIEEVGLAAAQWTFLGQLFPAPGFCDELQQCYFAAEMTEQTAAQDEDEFIERIDLTPAEVEQAISDGTLCDGKSIAIFTLARLKGLLA